MEPFATALVIVALFFFLLGGDDMVKSIFKSKADVARERRLEAEARAEEARYKARDDARDRL